MTTHPEQTVKVQCKSPGFAESVAYLDGLETSLREQRGNLPRTITVPDVLPSLRFQLSSPIFLGWSAVVFLVFVRRMKYQLAAL